MNKTKLIGLILGAFALGAFSYQQVLKVITAADVRGAANIAGLEFTQSEVDSLLPELDDYRKSYDAIHKLALPNAVPMALVFNPVPPGYQLPVGSMMGGYSSAGNAQLPGNMDDLAYYSVVQLSKLIIGKKITSEELTKYFIERLKKYDPKLKCVVTLTEKTALEQARQADEELKSGVYKGMLHGIPYGLKDIVATNGHPTTWGSKIFKDQVFNYDATVVEKLRAAGAVLVAKLSVGELAMGDTWFGGQTKNPWDMKTGSSGSSAGSAAAVSAGLVPFAIGTETLGSIVSPATTCGVTGLRPTFGRVSRHGIMTLNWSMDKVGPIARSAEDCAVVLSYITGADNKDLSVINMPFTYDAGVKTNKKLKIGYLKKDFDKAYPFKTQDSLTLKTLQAMGYELIAMDLPVYPDISFLIGVEAAAAFDDLTRTNKDDQMVRQTKDAWPNYFRQARMVPAVEYVQANRVRAQMIAGMEKVFKEVDVYLNPTWASSSLLTTNLTGHPCVVVPNGMKNNKPTSITFTGKLFEEATLLAVAQAYQEQTGFDQQKPKLD
ncbi:MAG: amidase [Saprospiraceae bacterium]